MERGVDFGTNEVWFWNDSRWYLFGQATTRRCTGCALLQLKWVPTHPPLRNIWHRGVFSLTLFVKSDCRIAALEGFGSAKRELNVGFGLVFTLFWCDRGIYLYPYVVWINCRMFLLFEGCLGGWPLKIVLIWSWHWACSYSDGKKGEVWRIGRGKEEGVGAFMLDWSL